MSFRHLVVPKNIERCTLLVLNINETSIRYLHCRCTDLRSTANQFLGKDDASYGGQGDVTLLTTTTTTTASTYDNHGICGGDTRVVVSVRRGDFPSLSNVCVTRRLFQSRTITPVTMGVHDSVRVTVKCFRGHLL